MPVKNDGLEIASGESEEKAKPLVCVADYERRAAQLLPEGALGYYSSGALDETTLRENCDVFNEYYIIPRVLRDVSLVDMSTSVLGHSLRVPVGVAPTAMQRMAHPDGEAATARAAGALGTCFTLSTIATTSIEDVARQARDTVKFFQLYIYKDRSVTEALVRRAEAAGFTAIALTVDATSFGIRRADARNKFSLPPQFKMANFQSDSMAGNLVNISAGGSAINEYVNAMFDPSLDWDDLAWLVRTTRLPVIIKGAIHEHDVERCLELGVKGIWVSNHGGRQVDGTPPTLKILQRLAHMVKGRCSLIVDGGFRSGTDVFKALALGADLVMLGRPVLWGLACGGQQGVEDVLNIFVKELRSTMSNSGCHNLAAISPGHVEARNTYAAKL